MKYSELTEQQKQVRSKIWVEVLNKYCKANPYTGNRPCDNGCPCDKCHYDYVIQLDYVETLKAKNQPLLDDEIERFKDYL